MSTPAERVIETAKAKLSAHFSLAEFVVSESAARHGIDNTPPNPVIVNLHVLAHFLEGVRTLLKDAPLLITSGYRCAALNKLIKGAKKSQHMDGRAADFIAPRFGDPLAVCRAIAGSELLFDQLIYEFGWVHISFVPPPAVSRHAVLTFRGDAYLTGIVP